METMLGFSEPIVAGSGDNLNSGYKLVPWICWEDWRFVNDSLFSPTPGLISAALRRISAWRSRGCIPVEVQVTASLIKIQQMDPFFRDDSRNMLHSEEMLCMLYSMAITRLVNGVVEKTRKKMEVSIGAAAHALGIPRMLIDVRHEASHRDLPSLRLVRLASVKALDWLKSYYWEPQSMAIPSDQTSNVRKEIKSVLHDLFLSLNVKQAHQSNSLTVKQKSPKKHINKVLKKISRLYSSFSLEVISVLLRFLLKALDFAVLVEHLKNPQISHSASSLQPALEDWKPVIRKLSHKEPDMLLTLYRKILDMIETLESENHDGGAEHFKSVDAISQSEQLSYLFEWLVVNCKGLKFLLEKESTNKSISSNELDVSNATLVDYLRRCLKLSSTGNSQLMRPALVIAHLTQNSILINKLKKLAKLNNFNLLNGDENLLYDSLECYFSQQEEFLRQAAGMLEVFKCKHGKDIDVIATNGHVGRKSAWLVARSWNSCSIGMLPPAIGYSAHLPVLDSEECQEEVRGSSEIKEQQLNLCNGKREADYGVQNLHNSCPKRLKGRETILKSKEQGNQSLEGYHGHLRVGGVWKIVGEDEICAVESDIRILV